MSIKEVMKIRKWSIPIKTDILVKMAIRNLAGSLIHSEEKNE